MTFLYLKALHIIFVVTWFAGIFYMPRLLIYNREAQDKIPQERDILQAQFGIMMKRLWYGITWPSAILTLVLGPTIMFYNGFHHIVFTDAGWWLTLKLAFVLALYVYFFWMHKIFRQQLTGNFRYTSMQLRMINEIATVFLIAIVMLVVVKTSMSLVWGLLGLVVFVLLLMAAIKIYKKKREKNS